MSSNANIKAYPSPKQSSLRQSLTSRSTKSSRFSDGPDVQEESSSHAGSRDSWARSSHSGHRRDDITPEPSGEEERNGRLQIFRKRVRRSGGFLLDSNLPSRTSASASASVSPADDERPSKVVGDTTRPHSNGKGKATSNRLSAMSDQSSAVAPSPLSRQFQQDTSNTPPSQSLDGTTSGQSQQDVRNGTSPSTSSSTKALDPAQLVQMALSLSEGRRRHVSANLTIPSTAATDSRRIRSAGAPILSVAPGSPLGNDFLRPQPAPNHPASPRTPRTPGRLSQEQEQQGSTRRRFDNAVAEDDDDDESLEDLAEEDEVEFQFSAATLNRAERARKFFELSSEYWRLLKNLPPLKSDSTARGNYTFVTNNSPGSTYPQINRIRSNTAAKHELGREYNPLQLLRNRRIRHREQRPLDPPVEAFNDVSKVKTYIDDVEKESVHPAYRNLADTISLPRFRRGSVSESSQPTPTRGGHKRTDTAVSRISRAETDWSFTPAELFADALWLEQDDNKILVENRHGNRIFPQLARVASYESVKDGRKSKESARSSLSLTDTRESAVLRSDDETNRRGRKKRKFLSLRKVEHTARRHLPGKRTRSNSASSDSSPTKRDRQRRALQHGDDTDHEIIGPLERHMRRMMEKEKDNSELISPDKWDRPDDALNAPDLDTVKPTHTQTNATSSSAHHTRNKPSKTDDHAGGDERGRSSFDDSTAPNSPTVAQFIPPMGMSLSPPHSRRSSPERKFAIFKSSSKERQKIDQIDFADSHINLPSPGEKRDELIEPGRPSFESLRPSLIKGHKTKSSITNTLFRSDTSTQIDRRGSKDTAASSRRFFKGGRIGDLVRSEGSRFGDVIWKKESPAGASDVSDTESDASVEHGESHRLKRPPMNLSRTSTASGGKSKYHTPNLPSFKPQNAPKDKSGTSQDSITQQSRDHGENSRSIHSDHLVPPRIDLPDEESDVSPGLSTLHTPNIALTAGSLEDDRRHSYGFLTPLRRNQSSQGAMGAPGSIGVGGHLYVTGLANVDSQRARKMSAMTMQGKRHWSISDRLPREAEARQVTTQDIDRVRALFLSSGIKAHELCKRATQIKDPPSDFFVSAAALVGQQARPVVWREEFILSARMLSKSVSSWSSGLDDDLDSFRSKSVPKLHSELEELKHQVEEKLTPLVHQTADEADAFAVALTTQQTLAVKQVNDAVDNILRHRRRKLRMLRRAGFAILEWVVLGLLWVVWFVVIIFKLVKGVVVGSTGAVRWMICI